MGINWSISERETLSSWFVESFQSLWFKFDSYLSFTDHLLWFWCFILELVHCKQTMQSFNMIFLTSFSKALNDLQNALFMTNFYFLFLRNKFQMLVFFLGQGNPLALFKCPFYSGLLVWNTIIWWLTTKPSGLRLYISMSCYPAEVFYVYEDR